MLHNLFALAKSINLVRNQKSIFFLKNIENYKILYGGSVNSNNASEIMDLKNVDGVLVGGASLDALEYKKIMNS